MLPFVVLKTLCLYHVGVNGEGAERDGGKREGHYQRKGSGEK